MIIDDDKQDKEAMFKDTKLGNPKAMRLPNQGCGWTLFRMFVY
jgi:hypothetical protein